ncbi:Uncharacterized calcium-binding protein [Galdieria sulphuraria]|uniref:Calcium-binding EF hand family protein n=1 Tax=Galdieria sulphuraria TaxID=130081 RepID=M2VVI5_GALSU|nr:calcium-binding EF hand family protein [Galdieria sulphuraria]EME27236.1 calcium-binding EF hand family protein [Galdieria sulphuraria]GJD07535.1 Uncharacterized calcium-binding protein [Galdieria sulphuraria]|eukprot:XP_005703756.1 calcium-binding EF hand family protein [Galdieria sulphuraria]
MNFKANLSVTTFNVLAPCYRKIDVSESSAQYQNRRQPPERTVCVAENYSCKDGECLTSSPKVTKLALTSGDKQSDRSLVSLSTWKKWAQAFFESIQNFQGSTGCKTLESQIKESWKTRARNLVTFLKEQLEADVICLQEYWCTQPEWCSIFENYFSSEYEFYTAKRSGDKADGLVTMVRRNSDWKVVDTERYYFRDCGERLLLATVLRLNPIESDLQQLKEDPFDCLVINTHLSFPHGNWGKSLRLTEVKKLLEFIDSYLELHPGRVKAIVVMGDFNSSLEDPVCQQVASRGFANSYYFIHGNENLVTHCNHKGQSLAVDKVYFKLVASSKNVAECMLTKKNPQNGSSEMPYLTSSLTEGTKIRMVPIEATVFPPSLGVEQWPTVSEYNLSDHRPVKVKFEIQFQDI